MSQPFVLADSRANRVAHPGQLVNFDAMSYSPMENWSLWVWNSYWLKA